MNEENPEETPDETLRRLQANETSEPTEGWGVNLSKPTPPPVPPNPYGAAPGGWGQAEPPAYQPYSAPPPPPPGYGPGPVPYGYAPMGGGVEHPKTVTILVLGILGIMCCGLLAPVAWVMGNAARKEVKAQPQYYRQDNVALTIGWILGIAGSCLWGLGFLLNIMGAALGSI